MVVGLSAGMTPYKQEDIFNDDLNLDIEAPVQDDHEFNHNAPPEDATAFQRLAYAFDIYENGKGYTSVSSQIIDIIGNVQYAIHNKYRGGGMDFSEEWYKMTGIASSYGRNRFITSYSDGVYIKNTVIEDSKNYNYDAKTYNPLAIKGYSNITVDSWINQSKLPKLNSFFTTVNKDTAEVTKYDNKGRDKNYYTVVVSLNINKLDENFVHSFESNGAAGLKINNIFVTFKISKNSGYFLSAEATGSITATYIPLNLSTSVDLMYKEVYTSMNTSAEEKILQLRKQNFNF